MYFGQTYCMVTLNVLHKNTMEYILSNYPLSLVNHDEELCISYLNVILHVYIGTIGMTGYTGQKQFWLILLKMALNKKICKKLIKATDSNKDSCKERKTFLAPLHFRYWQQIKLNSCCSLPSSFGNIPWTLSPKQPTCCTLHWLCQL